MFSHVVWRWLVFLRGWYCRTHTYYSKPSRRVGNFPWIQENRAFTFPQKKRNFHPPLLGEPNQLRFVSRTRPQGCFLFIGKYATILSHYRRFYSPLPVGLFSAPILRTWPASASLCSYLSVPLLYHVASVLFLLYTFFSYSFYFGCKGEVQTNFESILFLNGTFLFYLYIFLFYFYISFQVYPIELYPPPLFFFRRRRFGREKKQGRDSKPKPKTDRKNTSPNRGSEAASTGGSKHADGVGVAAVNSSGAAVGCLPPSTSISDVGWMLSLLQPR